jgi:hypothetical protein
MHVEVIWVVEEIDTQLLCLESLNRCVHQCHSRSQQLRPSEHSKWDNYSVNDSSHCPPSSPLLHKRHPSATTRSPQSHRLRLTTRILRTPPINNILHRLRRRKPNKVRGSTLRPENRTIFLRPLHQPFREFGFQVLESLVDDRRSRRERGHMFSSGVPDENVPSREDDEDSCESDEHWVGFQFRTEVAIPNGELLG